MCIKTACLLQLFSFFVRRRGGRFCYDLQLVLKFFLLLCLFCYLSDGVFVSTVFCAHLIAQWYVASWGRVLPSEKFLLQEVKEIQTKGNERMFTSLQVVKIQTLCLS